MKIAQAAAFTLISVILMPAVSPANVKTKVKIKNEKRDKSYEIANIKKLVVFTIRPFPRNPDADGQWPPPPRPEVLPDTISQRYSEELAETIRSRFPSITVVTSDSPNLKIDTALIAFARDSLGADGVMIVWLVDLSGGSAFKVTPGKSPFGYSDASETHRKVKLRYDLYDGQSSRLVWSITSQAETKAGGGFLASLTFKHEEVPPVQVALDSATARVYCRLPF